MTTASPRPVQLGHFEWQPASRRLLVDGRPAPLGSRALDLLAELVAAEGRTVTKQLLLDRVWPGLVVEENNLQVQVSALRKVLGPTAIVTVPGRGYRLDLPGMLGGVAPTPPAQPGQLPAAPPPLVGRDAERLALVEQLRCHRLVTLVGPGGIGKTCLALAAAADLAPAFDDGVRVVELAAVSDPALLVPVVAQALQLTLPHGDDPVALLANALRPQRRLLLIDNAEHLVDAVSALAVAVLAQAPGVHLLVTSQVRLHVAGEQVQPLPPLGLPAPDEPHPDERFGALQLFVQRARAVQPDFRPGPKEAALVAEVCRRLDGLPLAIELAAARVRLLGLQGLRDRLHDGLPQRLRLLAGGARDAPERQRTLQATLAWSHALLDAGEQAVLRRLGLFVGGFTLELAQQVAADDHLDAWAVLEALSGLVDKSLVAVDADDPPRYRLLETTRAFAVDRLVEAAEAAITASRHAAALRDLFLAMDNQRFDDTGAPDSEAMQARLAPEVGNVRAALAWALGPGGDRGIALGLATGSANLFMTIGQTLEALPWLLALQPADGEALPPALLSDFWRRLALLGGYGGLPHRQRREAAERAVAWARRAGGRRRLLASLSQWGHVLLTEDRDAELQDLLEEMRQLERPGDPAFLLSGRLGLLAGWLNEQQRFDESVAVQQQQQRLLSQARGEHVAMMISRANLTWTLNVIGRHDEAAAMALQLLADPRLPRGLNVVGFDAIHALAALGRLDEALATARRLSPQWHLSPLALHGEPALARLASALGRLADALRIQGACAAFRQARGLPADALTVREEARLAQACSEAGIDAAQQRRLVDEGAVLDPEACVALVLGDAR